MEENYKQCTVCEEIKHLDEFYKQKKTNKNNEAYNYYNPECKECCKKRTLSWRINNRESFLKNQRRNNEKTKELIREYSRKQKENGYMKNWSNNNKDRIKNYQIYRKMHKSHNISKIEWENCKTYFGECCAYCGISEEAHKKMHNQQLHKEHVNHNGSNMLDNCVPACRSCNSKKWEFDLNDWYNDTNPVFDQDRLKLINQWLEVDYLIYMSKEQIKQ